MELNGSFCYNTVILSEAAQQRCEAEESSAFYGCEDPSTRLRLPRDDMIFGGKKMEGFTVALALVDAIPVLSFGISMVIIASRFDSPLFMIGAFLSVLAGCCKVCWKLVLGIWKKDLRWLNKPFLPMQITGFGFILGSLLTGLGKINWGGVLAVVTSLPSLAFFLAWIGLMFFLGWYRKNRFKNDDAHSNWTAQIVNAVGQTCLLLGILFAG